MNSWCAIAVPSKIRSASYLCERSTVYAANKSFSTFGEAIRYERKAESSVSVAVPNGRTKRGQTRRDHLSRLRTALALRSAEEAVTEIQRLLWRAVARGSLAVQGFYLALWRMRLLRSSYESHTSHRFRSEVEPVVFWPEMFIVDMH